MVVGMIISTSSPSREIRDNAPQRVRSFQLQGPAGWLEAVMNEGSADAPFAALVCHPHPLGGGTLHNKVVYHVMKTLNAPEWGFQWPVLRFNFRGTGLSEGVHDGAAEAEDVAAALRWLVNEYKQPVVVAGFSFGAAMALTACCSHTPSIAANVRAIAALGLPVRAAARRYDYSFLSECRLPKLFLSGDQDEFAPMTEFIHAASQASEPRHVALVPGADHFFTGHLESMKSLLSSWLKEHVYDPGKRSGL